MPARDNSIDDYFTRSIVGATQALPLGRSAGVLRQGSGAAWLEVQRGRVELAGRAARSLLATDPADALVGWPVGLKPLLRARRGLLAVVALAWTVLVAGATAWMLR
jgi:hypothetical protein